MALILDKTTIGIISVVIVTGNTEEFIESGYTETTPTLSGYIETSYYGNYYSKSSYVTGLTHLNYPDIFGGVNSNPYLIIRLLNIDRINNYAKIVVSIYKDKQARDNDKNPIETKEYPVSDKETFDLYFSMDVLENVNVYQKAYEYLDTILVGWKSDE